FFDKIEGYDALQGDPEATPPVEPTATELTGLAVVDDTTFTVKLREPFSQLPLTLGYQAYYPMPTAGLADPKAFDEAPVGNGPFQMDGTWQHDQVIRVKRYADYAGDPAAADAVEFRVFSDATTSFRELQADSLDIATSVPLPEIDATRAEFGDRFVERKSAAFNYLGFPMTDPDFAERPQLRQAISLAIDRAAIITALYKGTKQPAQSVIAPLVPGSRPDACTYCDFDPKRAKALLDEAGGFNGTLRLWYASGADLDETMEAIANQLRQNLGIDDIVFEPLPFAELLGKIKAREVDGPFFFNWLMDYPSPQSYLEPLYQSESTSNRTGYSSPEFDQRLADANRAPSLEEGIGLYQAAEDVVLADMPVVPLWFGLTHAVHSVAVTGVRIDPFSRIRVADVAVTG
ncbi:MAG: peptide ABC transporter substrate-binding protein, partial [Acidimicrobiia bacterium]